MTPSPTELQGMHFERNDGYVLARFERPRKANALTTTMMSAIVEEINNLDGRHLVLVGGPPVFSGGVDLADASAGSGSGIGADVLTGLVSAIKGSPAPIAAVVAGACVGGAVELVAACDVRVGTADATFSIPATSIGVVYRPEGLSTLLGSLTTPAIRRLVLLGQRVDSGEAVESGLLDLVDPDPIARAIEMCEAVQGGRSSFAPQKQMLNVVLGSVGPNASALAAAERIRDSNRTSQRETLS